MTKVTIIINCHNGEKFLSEALNSIKNQSSKDWTLLFFDNNSSDSSKEIAMNSGIDLDYYNTQKTISLGEGRATAD